MTELEKELLAIIERMNGKQSEQEIRAIEALTAAVNGLSNYLELFTDALNSFVAMNQEARNRSQKPLFNRTLDRES
jgi:hypothetical protein